MISYVQEFTSPNGDTLNPLLSPGGGLIETGDLFQSGALLNLEKMMVSVLHKELEYKVETLKNRTRRLEVMQPSIRVKFELPVGE